ncbi:MAG: sigma-54-dependent Fis family transcriptional regulator [Gemmatales bacterium]|nr:MAG: sigma-54-dependent Fis family transcriptional regulator [Gemmatales bacterium]
MHPTPSAYLIRRENDEFRAVFPLDEKERYTLGRIATNRIVVKDELCSREHAEIYFADGHWHVRDNNSLNGTQVNDVRLTEERRLFPGDEIRIGRTSLLFVKDLSSLPELQEQLPKGDLSIKERVDKTRFLIDLETPEDATATPPTIRKRLGRNLAILYRAALEMGSAPTFEKLGERVLSCLLDAIPADAGAILLVRDGKPPQTVAYKQRDERLPALVRISQSVSNEVLSSKEAILAEDVSSDEHLRNRDSLTELRAASLICAPVIFEDRIEGLIHLYSTDRRRHFDREDLEFALAVARQLGVAIHQIKKRDSLTAENRQLRSQLKVESELIGNSPAMKNIEEQIRRVAGTSATVLIRGESGTGKELVARAIHYTSPRRDGPFVCLNCAALPETLLESELFGHEKGAFTGATERKIGKFEAANNGTIFLDEIGEMNPATQAKLLRILEGHPYERVGGQMPIHVDVRVVAATNQPLEQAIQEGHFRRDLFFRLQVVEIRIPPLRERIEDIPLLADHFLKRYVQETGRKFQKLTPAALQKLKTYHWPGNVRELRNVIERAVALGTGPDIDAKDILLSSLDLDAKDAGTGGYEPIDLAEVEKRHIMKTLEYTNWNKSQAAAILKIERSTLDRKIKAYNLQKG